MPVQELYLRGESFVKTEKVDYNTKPKNSSATKCIDNYASPVCSRNNPPEISRSVLGMQYSILLNF